MELDFKILWETGRAVLSGIDPYSVPFSVYPPAATYFFIVFGIFPPPLAFAILTLINISSILVMIFDKSIPYRSLAWVLYTPFIYALGVGQIDLILLLFYYLSLRQKNWVSVSTAVLLTIKPQITFVALPWILLQWARNDQKKLIIWLASCLILHLLPILFDPSIYSRWFLTLLVTVESYGKTSPSIFALRFYGIPLWFIIILAIGIIFVGLRNGQVASLIGLTLSLPFGYWYNLVMFIGFVPWKLLVPISWLSFILSYFIVHDFYPMLLIPFSGAVWLFLKDQWLIGSSSKKCKKLVE